MYSICDIFFRFKFFVFSAFYDRREENSIRVVGATKTRGPERVWCRLWYGNSTSITHSVSITAKVKVSYVAVCVSTPAVFFFLSLLPHLILPFQVIRENWNLKYSACFVLCPLRQNLTAPYSVSIVSRPRIPPSNHLLVRNADWDPDLRNASAEIPDKIAVCIKPIHFYYNQVNT
jgi:hypothetical protein